MTEQISVVVRCPKCGWRIMNKVTPASGWIEVKCSRCRKIVRVDLSLRRSIKCRRVG